MPPVGTEAGAGGQSGEAMHPGEVTAQGPNRRTKRAAVATAGLVAVPSRAKGRIAPGHWRSRESQRAEATFFVAASADGSHPRQLDRRHTRVLRHVRRAPRFPHRDRRRRHLRLRSLRRPNLPRDRRQQPTAKHHLQGRVRRRPARLLRNQRGHGSVADTDTLNDVYDHFGGTNALISTGTSSGTEQGAVFSGSSRDGLHVYFHTTEQLACTDRHGRRHLRTLWRSDLPRVLRATKTTATTCSPRSWARPPKAASTSTCAALEKRRSSRSHPSPATVMSTFVAVSADGQHLVLRDAGAAVAEDIDTVNDLYMCNDGTIALLRPGGLKPCNFGRSAGRQSRVLQQRRAPFGYGH
jgi:hypothetical protein